MTINFDDSRKLDTIQKQEKLNSIFAIDEVGPGGANHRYVICPEDKTSAVDFGGDCIPVLEESQFQRGPRKEKSSTHGVLDTDLLEIVRDRMKSFQNGPYSSEYNKEALEHIEAALDALNRRVEDRIKRGVLGTNNK